MTFNLAEFNKLSFLEKIEQLFAMQQHFQRVEDYKHELYKDIDKTPQMNNFWSKVKDVATPFINSVLEHEKHELSFEQFSDLLTQLDKETAILSKDLLRNPLADFLPLLIQQRHKFADIYFSDALRSHALRSFFDTLPHLSADQVNDYVKFMCSGKLVLPLSVKITEKMKLLDLSRQLYFADDSKLLELANYINQNQLYDQIGGRVIIAELVQSLCYESYRKIKNGGRDLYNAILPLLDLQWLTRPQFYIGNLYGGQSYYETKCQPEVIMEIHHLFMTPEELESKAIDKLHKAVGEEKQPHYLHQIIGRLLKTYPLTAKFKEAVKSSIINMIENDPSLFTKISTLLDILSTVEASEADKAELIAIAFKHAEKIFALPTDLALEEMNKQDIGTFALNNFILYISPENGFNLLTQDQEAQLREFGEKLKDIKQLDEKVTEEREYQEAVQREQQQKEEEAKAKEIQKTFKKFEKQAFDAIIA